MAVLTFGWLLFLPLVFFTIQAEKVKVTCHSLLSRNLEVPDCPVYSVKAHKEIVNSIDGVGGLGIGDGAPEIVTGSRDGN